MNSKSLTRRQSIDSPVTAKEIGRQLGLSQPTVSRILSGERGLRVSPQTRQRVLETAARMGYRPNAVARSLRQGRTNIVGFYTGYGYLDARNPFLAELIGGLLHAADLCCQDLLVYGMYRSTSTDGIYGKLVDGRIDGLLVHTHAADPLVARLSEASLPVVAVADAIDGVPSVSADNATGMRLLLDHLWSRGHRKIAYVRPERRFASVEERYGAFREWFAARDLPASNAPVYAADFEETGAVFAAIQKSPSRPTAVCCWNDMTAMGLIYHCRQQGLRVPEDLAVVGFDGLMTDPRTSSRKLVSVGVSWKELTAQAIDLLMRQIAASPREKEGFRHDENRTELPQITYASVSLINGDTA